MDNRSETATITTMEWLKELLIFVFTSAVSEPLRDEAKSGTAGGVGSEILGSGLGSNCSLCIHDFSPTCSIPYRFCVGPRTNHN